MFANCLILRDKQKCGAVGADVDIFVDVFCIQC